MPIGCVHFVKYDSDIIIDVICLAFVSWCHPFSGIVVCYLHELTSMLKSAVTRAVKSLIEIGRDSIDLSSPIDTSVSTRGVEMFPLKTLFLNGKSLARVPHNFTTSTFVSKENL